MHAAVDEADGVLTTDKGSDASLFKSMPSETGSAGSDVLEDITLEPEARAFDFLIDSNFSFHSFIAWHAGCEKLAIREAHTIAQKSKRNHGKRIDNLHLRRRFPRAPMCLPAMRVSSSTVNRKKKKTIATLGPKPCHRSLYLELPERFV